MPRVNISEKSYPFIDKIQLLQIKEIDSPCLIGFKKAFILLPNTTYDDGQLDLILKHELIHYRQKDILWKIIIDVLCSIFWWNPLFVYLKKITFQIIEIGNDMELTASFSEKDKVCYMQCLKNLIPQVDGKDVIFSLAFCKHNLKELKQRLEIISHGIHKQRSIFFAVTVLVIFLLFSSFAIIFEPSTMPDEGIPLTSENTYLIQKGNTYEVYFNEEYLFTTDDLTPFRGVKIL